MPVLRAAKQLAETLSIARLGVHLALLASARLGEFSLREAVARNGRGGRLVATRSVAVTPKLEEIGFQRIQACHRRAAESRV